MESSLFKFSKKHYNITFFYYISDQINAALVSTRKLFLEHKNILNKAGVMAAENSVFYLIFYIYIYIYIYIYSYKNGLFKIKNGLFKLLYCYYYLQYYCFTFFFY